MKERCRAPLTWRLDIRRRQAISQIKAVAGVHMARISLWVNDKRHEIEVSSETPLLWVLRDTLGLTGTKFGCGMGLCGACTVHLDGDSVRACQTPVGSVHAKRITTIEGLSLDRSHPVQKAWIAEQVPQCGYCQSGQIMQAVAFLAKNPHPSRDEIDQAMSGNICRCATYQRIRRAIQRVAGGEI
jgi:isoquinoline 1-oxidoreductase subunit alpha